MIDRSRFAGPVEFAHHFRPRSGLRHVIMDWDGTISLLRGGWVEMMVDICLESAPSLQRDAVHAEMLALNGKPSIHQMTRIAELAASAGRPGRHPDEYQERYVTRITEAVESRLASLRAGAQPSTVMVPGSAALLRRFAERGIALTLVSGTPFPELTLEADLLGVASFFEGRLHGPADTADRDFSKRATIHQIITEHGLDGESIVAIGDGPIEMSEIKAHGGLAIAVTLDETAIGQRGFDDFKRRQLLEAGADLVVPDFQDAGALVDLILGVA